MWDKPRKEELPAQRLNLHFSWEKQLGNILFWLFTHCMSYLGWSPWPEESVTKILKIFVTYGTASRMGHFVQYTVFLGWWIVFFQQCCYPNKPLHHSNLLTYISSQKQFRIIPEHKIQSVTYGTISHRTFQLTWKAG